MNLNDNIHRYTYTGRHDGINTLDDNSLSLRCPLDNGHITRAPQHSLGLLGRFPPELMHRILIHLDMQTLTRFRRVNLMASLIVDSVYEYRAILTHAPDLLRGALSTRADQWITCEDMYKTMCTAECESCGDFAGYICLITCKRVCFYCFSEEFTYVSEKSCRMRDKFLMDYSIWKLLPRLRNVPGVYSPNGQRLRSRFYYVNPWSLLLHPNSACPWSPFELKLIYSWRERFDLVHQVRRVCKRMSKKIDRDKVSEWLREYRDRVYLPETGGSDAPCRDFSSPTDPRRFMTIVQIPHLDRVTRTSSWGLSCVACKNGEPRGPRGFRRRFTTKSSFEKHVEQTHHENDFVLELS